MSKPNVFIRGIYSTALTELFLNAGYNIIFPSHIVKERFNLPLRPDDSYSKDITIRDRLDKQGISIMFKKNIWDSLVENNFKDFPLNLENFPNLIKYDARFHKNSIYRGLVVKSNKVQNYSYIRLTPGEIAPDGQEDTMPFQTTLGRYSKYLPQGTEGIFQVTHEDHGRVHASLGSYYTIPGDLIVIVPYNNKVIISREISNPKQKKRLFDLGKDIQKQKKYGYIFRTAAELATNEEILEEVEKLEKDLINTQNTITQFPDRIGEIYSNYHSMNLIFTRPIKIKFDTIRAKHLPTIMGHHMIKSAPYQKQISHFKDTHRDYHGSQYRNNSHERINPLEPNALLNYTENLMSELPENVYNKAEKHFLKQYFGSFLKRREQFQINHQKLSGHRITLSYGYIQNFEHGEKQLYSVTLRRKMREGGIYDGLGTPIERGDYAIATYTEGSWFYKTTYYTANNEPKGAYFNINTPIEITHHGIQYIDLEIDVVENMVGERKIIDKEYLDQAYENKLISEEVYQKSINLAEKIKNKEI